MKATKIIALLLLVVIICQSCVAYQTTSLSLNEAHDKGHARVTYTNGRHASFKNIILKDSIYYGIPTYKNMSEKLLNPDQISGIYHKDIKKSKKQSRIFGFTFLVVLGVGIGLFIHMVSEI